MITTSENDIKERLSIGYVTLIAARAGCMIQDVQVDRDSVDVTIRPVKGQPVCIDAQLKSTSAAQRDEDSLLFDLPVKNYDDLRSDIVGNARILIVLDLHEDPNFWINCEGGQLVSQRIAYWADLYGQPPTANQNTKRIRLPLDQAFTPDSLKAIMQQRYANIQAQAGGVL